MSDLEWQAVIGLEIHAQLCTNSKLFSSDSSQFTNRANVHIHPVSLGLPGVLPVLNQKVLEYSTRVGLALNCHINQKSVFARKNYFYPDLPKGYQISQYDQPLCEKGHVQFNQDGQTHKIRIRRVHIEEDAGQFHHHQNCSLVNFNRSGVPLVEIVSEPDISSPQVAGTLARIVCNTLKYIEVCDGSLEEGSLRCDCNVSIKKPSDSTLGVRTEIKNINSFKFVQKAIEYEIKRQICLLNQKQPVFRETRLYDSSQNKTFPLRSKEEASDYRYFPDPDLPPVVLSPAWIEKQKSYITELPLDKLDRFQKQYSLSKKDANLLVEEKSRADYFEEVVAVSNHPSLSANWLLNEVLAQLNESKKGINSCPVSAKQLGQLIQMIDQKIISGKIAKRVFSEMWKTGEDCKKIIQKQNLKNIQDEDILLQMVDQIIHQFPNQVKEYQEGKQKIFGFFVGEIMKLSKGQADPKKLTPLLIKKLKS